MSNRPKNPSSPADSLGIQEQRCRGDPDCKSVEREAKRRRSVYFYIFVDTWKDIMIFSKCRVWCFNCFPRVNRMARTVFFLSLEKQAHVECFNESLDEIAQCKDVGMVLDSLCLRLPANSNNRAQPVEVNPGWWMSFQYSVSDSKHYSQAPTHPLHGNSWMLCLLYYGQTRRSLRAT